MNLNHKFSLPYLIKFFEKIQIKKFSTEHGEINIKCVIFIGKKRVSISSSRRWWSFFSLSSLDLSISFNRSHACIHILIFIAYVLNNIFDYCLAFCVASLWIIVRRTVFVSIFLYVCCYSAFELPITVFCVFCFGSFKTDFEWNHWLLNFCSVCFFPLSSQFCYVKLYARSTILIIKK